VDARIMRYVATAEARRAGSPADRAEHRRQLVVLAALIVLSAIAHLPLFLFGFAVFWFVVLRHRGPRRAYAAQRYGRPPHWR